ncbi:hypothetical protein [Gordonia westfalica]|nr:hypothetical protein [Gordonia westfalica]
MEVDCPQHSWLLAEQIEQDALDLADEQLMSFVDNANAESDRF